MPTLVSITLFILIISLPARSDDRIFLREFKTDICTAWPDRLGEYDWSHCCVEHDLYLWAGGESQQAKAANKRLRTCVEKASTKFFANLMFFGIELGGYSPIRLKDKKFGNAWGESNSDTKLNSEEISILIESLRDVDLENYNYLVPSFIQNLKKINQ